MIIVRVSGGLGNQLFQYSFARGIKERTGLDVRLDIDSFHNQKSSETPRSFKLDAFSITLPIATQNDKEKIGLASIHDKSAIAIIKRKFQALIDTTKPLNQKKIILEPSFTFHPEMLANIQENSFISGIWQSEKYFNDNKDIIQKELTLKKTLSYAASITKEQIENSPSVSLHIRRGDYLTNNKTKPLPLEYYARAISYIKNRISKPHFFIFSDDIEWTKQNLDIKDEVTYVSHSNIPDYEELTLMSLCKNNIIANSSFSWWSAWLNNNQEKIVIAPKNWFSVDIDTRDLIPESWIQL